MNAKEHRQVIYKVIEKILDRPLTTYEQQEVSLFIRAYIRDEINVLRIALSRANKRIKPLGKSVWALLNKKGQGVPEEELVFLKQALKLDDEDDDLTKRLIQLLEIPIP